MCANDRLAYKDILPSPRYFAMMLNQAFVGWICRLRIPFHRQPRCPRCPAYESSDGTKCWRINVIVADGTTKMRTRKAATNPDTSCTAPIFQARCQHVAPARTAAVDRSIIGRPLHHMPHRVEGITKAKAEQATAQLNRRKAAVRSYVAHWATRKHALSGADLENSTKEMANTAAGAYDYDPSVVAITLRFFKFTQRLHLDLINAKRNPGEELAFPLDGVLKLPGQRAVKKVRLGALKTPPRLTASSAPAAYCALMKDMGALLQYVFSGESAGALVLPHHHELVKDSISKLAEAVASAREVEEDRAAVDAFLRSTEEEVLALSKLSPLLGTCSRTCRRIPQDLRDAVAFELASLSHHIAERSAEVAQLMVSEQGQYARHDPSTCEPSEHCDGPAVARWNPMRGSAYWFREGGGAHRSPRRYDLGAQPADECCSKYSFRNKGTTAGLFTVMCGHGFIWGFHRLEKPEGPRDFFTVLYQYCEELPNIICYDNSCSLSTYCLRREYSTFRKCRFLVDKFHSKGHTCSRVMHADEDNARLLKQGEAVGRNATSWAEHWHSFLGCCSASMPTMSLERHMLYTCVLVYVFNQRRVARLTEETTFVRRQEALMEQQPYKARRTRVAHSASSRSCGATGSNAADVADALDAAE